MKKWQIGLIGLAIILLICAAVVWIKLNPPTVAAQVIYQEGTVLVNGNAIQANTVVKQGDIIATQDGKATINVYEAAFITLGKDTSVTVTNLNAKHSKVDQTEGSSSISFVKGTALKQLDVTQDGITRQVTGTFLSVSGALTYVRWGIVTLVFGNTVIHLEEDYLYTVNLETGKTTSRKLTEAEDLMIISDIEQMKSSIQNQRLAEIEKNPEVVSIAEDLTGLSKEQLLIKMYEYDTKTISDILALEDQVPVVTKSMTKIGSYTEELQAINRYITEQKQKKYTNTDNTDPSRT